MAFLGELRSLCVPHDNNYLQADRERVFILHYVVNFALCEYVIKKNIHALLRVVPMRLLLLQLKNQWKEPIILGKPPIYMILRQMNVPLSVIQEGQCPY